MPKSLKVSPNQRIDLGDFLRSANDYTLESTNFDRAKLLQALRSVVSQGFRVEVTDQAAGQITVYNGVGIDRDGAIVHNEQQVNDARTISLQGATTSFYIEIEFASASSDVDSRAFWDRTYTGNTPPGKEFYLNVSTRITPDWNIVNPVSSTGFEVETDPNSTKIPIAFIQTGVTNEILSVTLVTASSVLEEDYASGATKLRVLDSSIFPGDSVTISVGAQSGINLLANDRVNNTLTIAAPGLLVSKKAGEIVSVSGTPTFIKESTAAVPTTGTDRRRLLFKGDEIRGSALSASKYTVGGRDDLDIRSQKDWTDFTAAQIREMKFGSLRSDSIGGLPPNSFSSLRYYDSAGSIVGARTSTITIGDGVSSLGDINGTNLATSLETAHAFLSSTYGGSIYVKNGGYVWDKEITFNRPLTLEFDSGATFIAGSYAGTINFTGNKKYRVIGLPSMLSQYPFYLYFNDPTGLDLTLEKCTVSRLLFGASATNINLMVKDCILSLIAGGASAIEFDTLTASSITKAVFDNTIIQYNRAADSSTAFLVSGDLVNTEFIDCKFDIAAGTGSAGGYYVSRLAAGSLSIKSKFNNCIFKDTNTGKAVKGLDFISEQIKDIKIQNCIFDFNWNPAIGSRPVCITMSDNPSVTTHLLNTEISGCDFTALSINGFPGTSASLPANVISYYSGGFAVGINYNNIVRNNKFGKPLLSAMSSDFVRFVFFNVIGSTCEAIIEQNVFHNFERAISVYSADATIENNEFKYLATNAKTATVTGIELNGTRPVTIRGNTMALIANSASATVDCYGINGIEANNDCEISNNTIDINGYQRGSTYGIRLYNTSGGTLTPLIEGNTVSVYSNNSDNYGIYVFSDSLLDANIVGNKVFISTITNVSTIDLRGIYVYSAKNDTATVPDRNQMTIGNNSIVIKPSGFYLSPNAIGIEHQGSDSVISNNNITTFYAQKQYGVKSQYADSSIVGNRIKQVWDSSQSSSGTTISYGIYYEANSAVQNDTVDISNNQIIGGKSTLYSIFFNRTDTPGFDFNCSVSINNNTMYCAANIAATVSGFIRVDNATTSVLSNVSICGNKGTEKNTSTWDLRNGIYVTSTGSSIRNVAILSNTIVGDISSASGSRVSPNSAIRVAGTSFIDITGNSITRWSLVSPDRAGISIWTEGSTIVHIVGNHCSPVASGFALVTSLATVGGLISNNSAVTSTVVPPFFTGGTSYNYNNVPIP